VGSVRKQPNGRWQAIYRDGAGRQHTRVCATRTAAKQWAADQEALVRAGTHRNPRAGRLLLRDWHSRWIAARVVEAATRRADTTYGRDVLEQWGTRPLDSITRLEVQGWVRRLEQTGRGPVAISKAVQQLTAVLEAAVHDDLLPSNPARGVRLPRAPKHPDRLITAAEEAALLEALPSVRDVAMVEVLLDTGLRYGELAGLHGHRVDLLRRELHVVETLTQAGQVKAYPKSLRSQRVVPLEERAALALARAMEVHGRDGLVFRAHRRSPGKATFGPVVGANWRSMVWQPALDRAGIEKPWPTPHDCRHTCLSRLVEKGMDLATVCTLAGHESTSTTSRYVHAGGQVQDRLRAGMRAVADGP